MKLSGELDYRIRYDVEHDLFHAQNIFSDEYIKPTFVEYVQDLEKENAELKKWQKDTIKARGNDYMDWSRMKDQLTKAKFLLKQLVDAFPKSYSDVVKDTLKQAEQFLSEVEK